MKKQLKLMIVAGEVSGDSHGAKLVNALKESAVDAELHFFGAASHKLRESGVEQIVNADELAITGLPEIARALPMFWAAFRKLINEAKRRQPDLVILIDFPDFNLKLARSLKKQGFKVVYYISPQLWAWRGYRIRTIKKYVDLLVAILPFEKDWYAKHGVGHVEYVGNPLAREVHIDLSKEEFCAKHGLDPEKPVIALLPGSRNKEITKILPPMLETAALMASKNSLIQFVIALAATRAREEVNAAIAKIEAGEIVLPEVLITVKGETHDALAASDAAAVASGTATLETAIIGTPFAIVYKTSRFNYSLLRPLIDAEHFGLVNLIAQDRIVKELIQDDFTKESLAEELFRLMKDRENEELRIRLHEVSETLGHGGASKRAANAILDLL